MDVSCFAEVPGNVWDKSYQDSIPDVQFPHIFVVGQAVNEIDLGDKRVAYEVIATEY